MAGEFMSRGIGAGEFLLPGRGAIVLASDPSPFGDAATPIPRSRLQQGETMSDVRSRWLAFYGEHVEPASTEIFAHVSRIIVGTVIVSAGAHVSSNEPSIVLFGYLRHGLVGRGVELFGIVLLLLNFCDGLYKLARLNWHLAYQLAMSICYIILSVRLIQLILAFRGE
jgi:hypothetical protein